jgi:hypothetical protein
MNKTFIHIQKNYKNHQSHSLCNEAITDWAFVGIDHAYWSLKNQCSLIICPDCLNEILKTFMESQDV